MIEINTVSNRSIKMKPKNLMILICFVLIVFAIFWFFNSPSNDLKKFVSKTQLHIKNLNSKLLDQENTDEIEIDSTYLELLGFVKNPKLYVDNKDWNGKIQTLEQENNKTLVNNQDMGNSQENLNEQKFIFDVTDLRIPPLVTAFDSYTEKEKNLIKSKLKYFPKDYFIIYDLDLSSSEQLKIKKLCNSSCVLKSFISDKYPRHLVDNRLKAYKPIIVQEVLNELGSIIWIEPPNIFVSNDIDNYLAHAKSKGILTWALHQPVSQLTHPSMFKYFNLNSNKFYFVHLLDTSKFIIYNNEKIHLNLMLPWVKCVLNKDCIAPLGSKFNGCDLNRKPAFLYSGCHRYEMSAFSIITARLFNYNQSQYTFLPFESKSDSLDLINSLIKPYSEQNYASRSL